MVIISGWFGRLGNNILQVLRAIYYAEQLGYNVVRLPPHNFFITSDIHIVTCLPKSTPIESIAGEFFDLKAIGHIPPSTAELKRIASMYKHQFLNQSLFVKPKYYLDKGDSFSATCHVRGGDVFGWRPHPLYLQPPLYYYHYLLKFFSNIYIVKEDNRNPVTKKLLQSSRVQDVSTDELGDFSLLMHSKNLALSASTFSYAAYLLSDLVEKLFLPSYYFNELPLGPWPVLSEIIRIELPGYIQVGQWKNSFFQRQKLINYKPK